jgi:trimeric autotransporter adhesin
VNPADYPEPLLEKRFQGDEPEDRPEDDDKRYDGLIAQEVEQTLINMGETWSGHSVNESDGKHGIQYGALVVPLIKAVQELKTDNDALKARVEALENN